MTQLAGQTVRFEHVTGSRNRLKSNLSHIAVWLSPCCFLTMGVELRAQLPTTLHLTNTTIASGSTLYQAGYSIAADTGFNVNTTSPASATVTFQAGSTITLGPGFQANAGSATTGFLASIVPSMALQTFISCAGPSSSASTCTLPTGSYTVSQATGQILIGHSNVTVTGGTSSASQTVLVRDPAFTQEMMRVEASSPLTGITIQNLTFCGSSTLNAGPSPVGCPRVQTACGDQTARFPDAPECVDLGINNATTGLNPANPFSSTGPYSVTIANVDLEDATGHALSLYATAPNKPVNDVYIYGSAINYSEITGILYGVNGASYDRKFCDGDPNFNNDINVFSPRNIRIENNTFNNNNTGAMGGDARWVGLRHNTFINNYINPQAGNGEGGTVEFDTCTDTVQIYNNSMTGPSPSTFERTEGLELHGRNTDIQGNTISGYPNDGIGLDSTYNTNIVNNTITNNDQNYPRYSIGGIVLRSASPDGPCGQIERDTQIATISANISTGQAYGVEFSDFGLNRNTIDNVSIAPNNTLEPNSTAAIAFDDPMITLNAYSGMAPYLASTVPVAWGTPRALPVDAVFPVTSRCSTPGADRETFTFEASDIGGATNIAWIQAVFSQNGCDGDGGGPPCAPPLPQTETNVTLSPAPGCHFLYYPPPLNIVYLDGPNVDFSWSGGSSVVGPGGANLSNTYCTIHAGSSASQIQTEPLIRDLTLDIEFVAGKQNNKHIYVVTANSQNQSGGPTLTGGWNYWGWWFAP